MNKIAFQGQAGAYSEQALRQHFGEKAEAVGFRHLAAVFDAVESEQVAEAVVPVENSSAGSIFETYDLLSKHKLTIVGEVYLGIKHCLLALAGATRGQLKKVYSHPQALQQCQGYLDKLGVETEPFFDTAGAAAWVTEKQDPALAAIAGKWAAKTYGLAVMAENIQTYAHNTTRFLILSKSPVKTPKGDCKTSILFEARHVPAALYKCLGGFATNGINLTKLESRPSQAGIGRYRFHLDCEGHVDEPALDQALRELQFYTTSLRVLGSYSQAKIPE